MDNITVLGILIFLAGVVCMSTSAKSILNDSIDVDSFRMKFEELKLSIGGVLIGMGISWVVLTLIFN